MPRKHRTVLYSPALTATLRPAKATPSFGSRRKSRLTRGPVGEHRTALANEKAPKWRPLTAPIAPTMVYLVALVPINKKCVQTFKQSAKENIVLDSKQFGERLIAESPVWMS